MHRTVRILPLAAAPLALPALAHDAGALHLHASAVLVPLIVAVAAFGLVAAAAPRLQRLRVRAQRRDPRA